MFRPIINKVGICLLIALPGIFMRLTGVTFNPLADALIFGAAVVAAAFVLAWAAEAANKDISGTLAIALLALIAVLPEYTVDLFYAVKAGHDEVYTHYAAANMTGSNRLLMGFGWPLIALVALITASAVAKRHKAAAPKALKLESGNRLDVGFLLLLSIIAFAIPLMGQISLWFGLILVAIFAVYLWRASAGGADEEEELVGLSAVIGDLPKKQRRITVATLFIVSAIVILMVATPFAEALVGAGEIIGIDSYFLVQWLAPLASEAPEFIIAIMFALRGKGAEALGTLIASKVNQWSLLVGSLPIAYFAGGGDGNLPLDARQIEEFTLTATQTLLGVAMILALRFSRTNAVLLLALFAAQFAITDTTGRYVLSIIHVALALGFLFINRSHLLPTVLAPFAKDTEEAEELEETSPQTGSLTHV